MFDPKVVRWQKSLMRELLENSSYLFFISKQKSDIINESVKTGFCLIFTNVGKVTAIII
jgi:hypothetical protein